MRASLVMALVLASTLAVGPAASLVPETPQDPAGAAAQTLYGATTAPAEAHELMSAAHAAAVQPALLNLGTPALEGVAGFHAAGVSYFVGGAYGESPYILSYAPETGLNVAAVMPYPVAFAAVAFDGTDAYIFGGETGQVLTPLATILRFRPGESAAVPVAATLPVARASASVVFDGSVFYLFGGETAPTPGGTWSTLANITRFDPATGAVADVGQLPQAAAGTAAVWTGSEALVFGGRTGGRDTGGRLASVHRFDPASGALAAMPALPEPVAWASALWDGAGHAYLAGGDAGAGPRATVHRYTPCAGAYPVAQLAEPRSKAALAWDGQGTAHIYGGVKDTAGTRSGDVLQLKVAPATSCGKLPEARFSASAARIGGASYVFGGQVSASQATASVARFEQGGNAVHVADLPTARAQTAAVAVPGGAYILGGVDATARLDEVVWFAPGQPPQVVAHLPTEVMAASAVFDGQHIYLFGGVIAGYTDQIVRFDPATKASEVLPTRLPTARHSTSAAWDGTHAYVVGGQDASGTLSQVVRFTPATGDVQTMAGPMPAGPLLATAAFHDGAGALQILGGQPVQLKTTATTNAQRLDLCTGRFIAGPPLAEPRARAALVFDGAGRAYLAGGLTTDGAPSDLILPYDVTPQADPGPCPRLPNGLARASSVWTGDRMLVFGGETGTGGKPASNAVLAIIPDHPPMRVATLSAALTSTSAVWADGSAYVFGGWTGTTRVSTITRYVPGSTPTTAGLLPTPRDATSAVWDGRYAYIFGGHQSGGESADIVRFDPATGSSTVLAAKLPSPRAGTMAVWTGDAALILGGSSGGVDLDEVVRFTPAAGLVTVAAAKLPAGGLSYAAAVWDGAGAYLFGGSSAGAPSANVWRFTPCASSPQLVGTMPEATERATAVLPDTGQALVVGGRGAGQVPATTIMVQPAPAAAACAPTTTLALAVARPSAVWTGDRALLYGGETSTGGAPPTSLVQEYDAKLGPGTVAYQPAALTSTSAVWTGTAAYVFGGWTGSAQVDTVVRHIPGQAPHVVGKLPAPRDSTSAIWDGQHAYIFGGRQNGVEKADIVRFDPATNTAVTLAVSLPSARAETTAVWAHGSAYIIGGQSGASSNTIKQVVRFTPATGQVEVLAATLPGSGRAYAAAASDGVGSIYIFGGKAGASVAADILRLTPCNGAITSVGGMGSPRERAAAVHDTVAGKVRVFGGRGGSSGPILASTFSWTADQQPPAACVPTLTAPAGVDLEATAAEGAVAAYAVTATAPGESPPVSCSPESGSMFPLGTTTVTCTATSSWGFSASKSFTVTVVDTTAPAFSLPAPATAEATGGAGATVGFTTSATDLVDGVRPVVCTPTSGSTFPLGATTVTCTSSDTRGHTASGSFTVTVVDTTAPALGLPSSAVAEATGPNGAAVTYATTASDLVDGAVAAACSPASGSTFALGATTVSCSATDAHGNQASGSFPVTVVDTTAPAVAVPATVAADATSTSGAAVDFAASASDAVSGALPAACAPLSGSQFPLGITTVSCTATDAAGNTGTATFQVHVAYAWSGLQEPAAGEVLPAGDAAKVKFQLTGASAGITDASATLWVAPVVDGTVGPEQPASSKVQSANAFVHKGNGYGYVWSTAGLAAGTWQLRVELGDGVVRTSTVVLS